MHLAAPRFSALLSALRARKTVDDGAPFTRVLPIELWNVVFHELPGEDLLRAASVCRAFNELCIVIYLRDYKKSITEEEIHIHSHLLRPLQLSCVPLRVQHLVCFFWSFDILRNMRLLVELVSRSRTLHSMFLDFHSDLFDAHLHDSRAPYSQQTLLNTFRDVIYGMTMKNPGKIIIVANSAIFSCDQSDIVQWQHRDFDRHSRSFITKMRSTLHLNPRDPHLAVIVSPPSEPPQVVHPWDPHLAVIVSPPSEPPQVVPIDRLQMVHVWPISGAFVSHTTLITFNMGKENTLCLGHVFGYFKFSLSGQELSQILPHVALPVLQILRLFTSTIDPAVLRKFIARHPHIHTITYGSVYDDGLQLDTLIDRPLKMPALTCLEADTSAKILILLRAFDLSPTLYSIPLIFNRIELSYIPDLKALLRRISLRVTPTRLDLTQCWDQDLPYDDEEREIAASLFCVECVQLPQYVVHEFIMPIRWLVMLPALRRVEFSGPFTRNSGDPFDLIKKARDALPSGVELVAASE
ncbi:hypothetical protein B0H10DRAFT_512523 [Mycena sp. CBHHK59/15]|nr:hypothetical protein B0H10DRAFT_512523 [Mycena sp. CBHHK59/15]